MRALYIVALRTLTVALVLSIAITVTHQNFLVWWPNYQR